MRRGRVIDPLLPYQLEGADWLTQSPWRLLADDMGVGKSAQCVRALDLINAKKVLIICPAVARFNWKNEINLWSKNPRQIQVILKEKDSPLPDSEVVVCSYDYAAKFSQRLKGPWCAVISDEAHFIKSVDARRAKSILGRSGIIRNSKRFWAVTGTPAPNHPGELWILLYTFGVTPLSYDEFLQRYCLTQNTNYGLQVRGSRRENIPELKALLSKIMLRRMKGDVLKELPPITFDTYVVEPGKVDLERAQHFSEYFIPVDASEELMAKIKEQETLVKLALKSAQDTPVYQAAYEMKMIEAMAQSVSALRRYVGLQKVEPTLELVKAELESNAYEKLVIFGHHRDVLEELWRGLKKYRAVTLYGGTRPENIEKHVKNFQELKTHRVILANIMTAGTAINLTSAHNVIFIEQDWVPGNNAQAAMRVHRKGQTNPVTVRFITLANSFDERVTEVLKRKTRDLCSLLDTHHGGLKVPMPDPFS